MAFLLDSNIFIAYFRSNDFHKDKATNLIESLDSFFITDNVLFEVGTVLLLKEGPVIAEKATKFLSENNIITILKLNTQEFLDTVSNFPYQNSKLSFIDISLLILAKNRNLKLISFDEELMKAYEKC